jgi:hypothetical protein
MRATPRIRSLLLPLIFVGFSAHAQLGGDLQAQILYAFQAEDVNELMSVIQTLTTQIQAGGTDPALRYHLAHADYRLGLLSADARRAEPAFGGCIDQLKALLDQEADSAEALALQSACYVSLSRFKKLESVLLRSRAEDRLHLAYKLAPRNPRVAYFTALDEMTRAKPGSAESGQAYAQLQLAVQLFEQTSATRIDVPGWGHAEAYLELGKQLQARGDVLGARNWLEKSLIVAPDFKAAQRQLATLVRR